MANPEHVRRLKQGVDTWNQWRRENLDIRPDLRGQSFKGQYLAGADFSNADIRSANFAKAGLRGANFSGAQAGLQKRWAALLVLLSWGLAAVAGYLSTVAAYLVVLSGSDLLEERVAGWIALFFLAIFLFLIVRRGTNTIATAVAAAGAAASVFAFVFAIAIAIASAFTVAFVLAIAIAIASAFAVAFVLAIAIAIAIAGAIAGAIAVAIAVAFVLAIAVAVENTETVVVTVVVIAVVAVIVAGVSAYLSGRALRGDPRDAWIRSLAIAFAAMGGTCFREADLTGACFQRARLKSTDLRRARLRLTDWHQAKKLDRARLGGTILFNDKVRQLTVTHRGSGQSYKGLDLRGAHLAGADLSEADLSEADLSNATLEGACLERANLTKTQALGTRFHQATLTGACLEAWNIDSTTQLAGAVCDYVYLLNNQQERRPSSGNFAAGEFTKLFAEVLDTIDLIFRNGLDWRAFVTSFQQVQVENEDSELAIQSIENKGDGVVVVRVKVTSDADKAVDKERIHRNFNQCYEAELAALKSQYQAQLQTRDEQIVQYQRENANLWEVAKLMAAKPQPIHVETNMEANLEANMEATSMADSRSQADSSVDSAKYNLSGAKVSGFAPESHNSAVVAGENVTGNTVVGNQQNLSQPAQTLAEAAAEIQQLLRQLEASNPTATLAEQQSFVNLGISPTLKQRFAGALQAGWQEAVAQWVENKYAKVAIALLEGWQSNPPQS